MYTIAVGLATRAAGSDEREGKRSREQAECRRFRNKRNSPAAGNVPAALPKAGDTRIFSKIRDLETFGNFYKPELLLCAVPAEFSAQSEAAANKVKAESPASFLIVMGSY